MSTVSLPTVGVAHQATRAEKIALRVLQTGAVLSVAVSSHAATSCHLFQKLPDLTTANASTLTARDLP